MLSHVISSPRLTKWTSIVLFQSADRSKHFTTLVTVTYSHTHLHTLMPEAAMQGADCSSGEIWGSVCCSRTPRHTSNHIHRLSYSRSVDLKAKSLRTKLWYGIFIDSEFKKNISDQTVYLHWLLSYNENKEKVCNTFYNVKKTRFPPYAACLFVMLCCVVLFYYP